MGRLRTALIGVNEIGEMVPPSDACVGEKQP